MTTSSTGLSRRVAAALAYSGWWVTGAIVWLIERDPVVRRHAARSVTAFGVVALLIIGFCALAVASLSFMPASFAFFIMAAGVTWVAGVALWVMAMWMAIHGNEWRLPIVDSLIERWERRGRRQRFHTEDRSNGELLSK